ncbi:MAG: SDR family NAD(P)-dependent oxidoreductase [Desulfobulbaceae bacterium]|nr:SDR family NAD(P)-dependent oxidoreductase [Candidatus Kapabacteria bacterium]MBS3999387.1 SDR family NAD(P)-dependent oxidoreductase [Desulfobulbaceae bacterium]
MLKNKITLITGASAGIGKSCAEAFAEAGSNLILIARRIELAEKLASNLREKYGVECIAIQLDVRKYDEVADRLGNLPEKWQNVDILINNAGLARGLDKIQDGSLDDWEEMIDTNLKGLLYVSKLILPGMVARDSGMVVNIGSIAGREVYPKGNVYCATKHAVRAISQSMVIDLNGTNVRTCNIDPGMVETEFSLVRFRGDAPKAEQVYKSFKPLSGDDVAQIALFAASRPPHVNIQDIMVTAISQASAQIVNRTGV